MGPDAQAVAKLERSVLAGGGVTFAMDGSTGPAPVTSSNGEEPRVHVTGAERTVEALGDQRASSSLSTERATEITNRDQYDRSHCCQSEPGYSQIYPDGGCGGVTGDWDPVVDRKDKVDGREC
jgi:hypothetical protein